MAASRLTPLQARILAVLAPVTPPWTLTGGGALAGVHLGHRATRDLDLFWRGRSSLEESPRDVRERLGSARLDTIVLRSSTTFAELRVSDATDTCIVDLVAEPVLALQPPLRVWIGGAEVPVDSMHEILVNKLTTLLGRTELRDLVDVQALLSAGLSLAEAVRDAPLKDGGFSPLTLAWILESFEPLPLAVALGWPAERGAALAVFRDELIDQLTRLARPD